MLRSENWALGRSSGSHTIILEFIPNNLVGEENFSSTTEVNFQRFSCTHVIATRHQEEKTVLQWGSRLSPGKRKKISRRVPTESLSSLVG